MKEALTFDDVLLVPQKSTYSPSKVDTTVYLTKRIKLTIPLISAAMDTVTESAMAIALAQAGGLGIIHKNNTPEQQAAEIKKVKAKKLLVGASVALGDDAIKRAGLLAKAGADLIVTDVAHGHYYKVAETIKILKKILPKHVVVVGGNVATGSATADLIKAGADVIKVGVGPGSICTTRVIAGIGMPQLTAIDEAVKVARRSKVPVIADGGIKHSGDIVKALAAGATAVMMGSMFAGTDEAPGKVTTIDGKKVKQYRGMGSLEAMSKGSKDRYLQGDKNKKEVVAEGVVGYVDYKGPVTLIIGQMVGGLKQGLGYCGSQNIAELHKKAEFVRITTAGLRESHPHSLKKIMNSANYRGEDFL